MWEVRSASNGGGGNQATEEGRENNELEKKENIW